MTNTDLIERLRAYVSDSTVSPTAVELCMEAISALESRPAGVAVRKLEWIDHMTWSFADSMLGRYRAEEALGRGPEFRAYGPGGPMGDNFRSIDEAKDAAQADFDQRIRSALDPSPEIEAPAATVGEAFCECFGDLVLHASTHAKVGSAYRHCDLCGRPIKGTEPAPAAGEAEAVAWLHTRLFDAGWEETEVTLSEKPPFVVTPGVDKIVSTPLYLHPAPASLATVLRKAGDPLLPCPFCGHAPESDDDCTLIACTNNDCVGPSIHAPDDGDGPRLWNTRVDAALTGQPVAGDGLVKAAEELCAACEEEYVGAVCADEPDDEPIAKGEYGHHSLVTFGMIRRLRAALAAHKG